jgi:hypothetical protein
MPSVELAWLQQKPIPAEMPAGETREAKDKGQVKQRSFKFLMV